MKKAQKAEKMVREMERIAPYMYEGLYGSFLRYFMDSDKSKWTRNLSAHLSRADQEWADVGEEIALLLWERFEERISC
ncbi:MAG: hypothetical protein WCG29_10130 [Desulfomonile sp.]|jgi:hypothetical protein|nr:hypothetical protein [Deltaproteobacteria bacterium]